jgi:Asp-tRNA(Asn)/Glu-tRNA(Gln) amidotransferase A subunit family amidase
MSSLPSGSRTSSNTRHSWAVARVAGLQRDGARLGRGDDVDDVAPRNFTLLACDVIPWSLLGWPALTIPCPRQPGDLPVGVQLVAAPFEEARLSGLARLLES